MAARCDALGQRSEVVSKNRLRPCSARLATRHCSAEVAQWRRHFAHRTLRTMWRETDGAKAVVHRLAADAADGFRRSEEHARLRDNSVAPVRPQLVRMAAQTKAADACGALFAFYANGIAKNLQCVLTSIDPEGPHQFRVTLRRLRVALKVFRPVLHDETRRQLARGARELGAIASELRDADVVIGELIAPQLEDFGVQALSGALNDWRQEVRGRVRARLTVAKAAAFADTLVAAARTAARGKHSRDSANQFVERFLARAWSQTAPKALHLAELSDESLHDFRKDVKALRYAIELETAFSGQRRAKVARSLKRIQDLLGHVNDVATLTQFNPPLSDGAALDAVRARLIQEQNASLPGKIEEATQEWGYLAQHWPWAEAGRADASWSGQRDSNSRHPAPKAGALPG